MRVPRLWVDTIEEHRKTVSDAILDAAAALVARDGIAKVTMSEIASETGIGRATLYKYFADVDAILVAWHERHVTRHLARLVAVRDESPDAWTRLRNVLETYATIARERTHEHPRSRTHRHGAEHERHHRPTEIGAIVHQTEHVAAVERQLRDLFRDLLTDAARAGHVRDDVPTEELAQFCVHALAGAAALPTRSAVGRLVEVTLAGLRPTRPQKARRSSEVRTD